MSKIIRIEARSNIFEFNAEVPEKKAEKVLKFVLVFKKKTAKYSSRYAKG